MILGWLIASVVTVLFWRLAIGTHWALLVILIQLASTKAYFEMSLDFSRFWNSTHPHVICLSLVLCLTLNAGLIAAGWLLSNVAWM